MEIYVEIKSENFKTIKLMSRLQIKILLTLKGKQHKIFRRMLWKNSSITDIDTSVIGVTYTKYHKLMTILLSTLFLTDRNYDVP